MRTRYVRIWIVAVAVTHAAVAQSEQLHGQLSGSLMTSSRDHSISLFNFRYVPDLLAECPVAKGLTADLELSFNAFATAQYEQNHRALYDAKLELYRAWLRLSTERFEARIGLQKINFGSALLFRPLMWFDRLDPRDPLQLTDGVYGLLGRYTFQNNANIWLWGLFGNNETKGWEIVPTKTGTLEYGGRAQLMMWNGEVAVTYHHRRADLHSLFPEGTESATVESPEERLGLDGKWDIGVGLWFEGALVRERTDLPLLHLQRQWLFGADYTLGVGNGLYVATEYFRIEKPVDILASENGMGFSGLSVGYPIGILDQLSGMLYRDWSNRQWYRIVTWQRKYDSWSFYLLGFWNPETVQLYRTARGANLFAGTGLQLLAVFNH